MLSRRRILMVTLTTMLRMIAKIVHAARAVAGRNAMRLVHSSGVESTVTSEVSPTRALAIAAELAESLQLTDVVFPLEVSEQLLSDGPLYRAAPLSDRTPTMIPITMTASPHTNGFLAQSLRVFPFTKHDPTARRALGSTARGRLSQTVPHASPVPDGHVLITLASAVTFGISRAQVP
jgi:hypothetical protein